MGHIDLWREQCAEYRSKIERYGTQRSMERAMCGVQVKDREILGTEIYGESNVRSTGQRYKERWDTEIYGESNVRSTGKR